MADIPLDQYCAQLEQTNDGSNDDKILTEDPKLIFQSMQEEKERQERKNELEPDTKKAKIDSEGGKQFFSLPNLPNVEKEAKTKEEGELEEGEVLDDEQLQETTVKKKEKEEELETKKKKVALLLSYCGSKYHGMQKNPDVETIELKLLEALVKIGSVQEIHMKYYLDDNVNQLSFQRAARTDKGVSAARQVASLKLVMTEDFLEELNQALPKDIRCFGFERVTKSFDAKCSCSGRSYEYISPTFAFAPDKHIMDSSYRLSDEQFTLLNTLLEQFIGTHNFHNFTSGKHPSDKSSFRYITKCEAKKPFECRAHEFIAIEIRGQSFMIHQIRKMIGLCIAVCRGYCPKEHLDRAWGNDKIDIPRAPGLGLLLDRVAFKRYDEKFGNDGSHNALIWEDAELKVERFKIESIWHSIIEEEIKKSSMVIWLKTLSNHTYSTVGMNQPMEANYKGQKGVFPTKSNHGRGGGGGGRGKNNKYQGKRRPWESGPRGGGRGGRGFSRGGGGGDGYNNERR